MFNRAIVAIRQLLRGFWQPVGMCCGLDVKGLELNTPSHEPDPDEEHATIRL